MCSYGGLKISSKMKELPEKQRLILGAIQDLNNFPRQEGCMVHWCSGHCSAAVEAASELRLQSQGDQLPHRSTANIVQGIESLGDCPLGAEVIAVIGGILQDAKAE